MSDTTYVKHVKTGEVFEVNYTGDLTIIVWDGKGEKRVFKTEMLTPYEPEEAWETIRRDQDISMNCGSGILVCVQGNWYPIPSDYTRTTTHNGKLVVQRRKG